MHYPLAYLFILLSALHAAAVDLTGDTQCGSTMCIQGVVNGSSTTYILFSLGKLDLGWMGMGFGRQMSGTPMVILWINSGGSVTVSQRTAPAEIMPTLDSNPPRNATQLPDLTLTSSPKPQLAFSVPTNTDTKQSVIYAFGTTKPDYSAENAVLLQHSDYGVLQLDLTKPFDSNDVGKVSSTGLSSNITPLLPFQKLIIAHAIFCTVGFLLFLPSGALLARYLRTFFPTKWFRIHWIVQFAIAGPVIVVGIILGVGSVSKAKGIHLNDDHKKWGIAIIVLYLVQCGLGAFIHFVKNQDRKRRPPQNFLHAVLGLFVIGLAFYQVHSGYYQEWPTTTGRGPLPRAVSILFWTWLVFLPFAYVGGLGFLPKQYHQESRKTRVDNNDHNLVNLERTAMKPTEA